MAAANKKAAMLPPSVVETCILAIYQNLLDPDAAIARLRPHFSGLVDGLSQLQAIQTHLEAGEHEAARALLESRRGAELVRTTGGEWAFVVAFLVVGLGALVFARVDVGESRRTMTWPSAPGTVVSSKLNKSSASGGPGGLSGGRSYTGSGQTGSRPGYRTDISYQYVVDGQTYFGSRVTLELSETLAAYQNEDDAAAVAARYPIGKSVTVYYDPSAPEVTVLERVPTTMTTIIAIVIGLLAVLVAGGSLGFLAVRNRPTARVLLAVAGVLAAAGASAAIFFA